MNRLLKLASFLLACLTAAVASWLFGFATFKLARMIEPSLIFASYLLIFGMVLVFSIVYNKAIVYWRSKLEKRGDE
jgi:hypothetical protein